MLGQVIRRRTDQQASSRQPPGDQTRTAQIPDANRQVVAFLNQVYQSIDERNVEAHLRVEIAKGPPYRCQATNAESHRHVDPQQTACGVAFRSDFGLGVVEIGQQVPAATQEHLALGGQGQAPRGSVQQPYAEA